MIEKLYEAIEHYGRYYRIYEMFESHTGRLWSPDEETVISLLEQIAGPVASSKVSLVSSLISIATEVDWSTTTATIFVCSGVVMY